MCCNWRLLSFFFFFFAVPRFVWKGKNWSDLSDYPIYYSPAGATEHPVASCSSLEKGAAAGQAERNPWVCWMAQQVGERGGLDGQGGTPGAGRSAGDPGGGKGGGHGLQGENRKGKACVRVRVGWGKWPKTKTGSWSLEIIRARVPRYLALCLPRGEVFGLGSLFGA